MYEEVGGGAQFPAGPPIVPNLPPPAGTACPSTQSAGLGGAHWMHCQGPGPPDGMARRHQRPVPQLRHAASGTSSGSRAQRPCKLSRCPISSLSESGTAKTPLIWPLSLSALSLLSRAVSRSKSRRAKALRLTVPPTVPAAVPRCGACPSVAVTHCPAVPLRGSGTVGQSSIVTGSRMPGGLNQTGFPRLVL